MTEPVPIWEGAENNKVGRFPRSLGLVPEQISPGHVVVHLREPPDLLRNSREAVNGGVIATMFDWALGAAIASGVNRNNDREKIAQATVSLDIVYMRAAMGENFRVTAALVRHGSTLAFAEGSLEDDNGDICATAHGVWRLLPQPSVAPPRHSRSE
jgi:uncharacterized protein (TIGR00369 family)